MNPSIRKYLLINLLVSVTIVISLTAVANYYLAQKDIQRHLDLLLSQSALNIHALVSKDLDKKSLRQIQAEVNRIPQIADKIYDVNYLINDANAQQGSFEFQVWDNKGHLLLRSKHAPKKPLTDGTDGYSIAHVDAIPRRVFSFYDPFSELTVVVAESLNDRAQLGQQITYDYLFVIMMAYPLLGALIWIIIGRGLAPLKRVANAVSHRAPNFLEPVDVHSVAAEIKPLVEELNRLFLRLQRALDREKRFAGDAAHELKTPLAALKTQAQVALKCENEDERKQTLLKLIKAVDRSSHIVEQLLTLSRLVPDATTGLRNISQLELPKIVSEIIMDLAPGAVDKNIELELKVNEDDLFILGNATAVEILARNLIDNAIRYTPEAGRVTVSIFTRNESIVFQVQDTGVGIAPELRSRVFERFYRILGNESSGSGLGLSIVKQIASLHRAHMFLLEPEDGPGLVFEIAFPDPEKVSPAHLPRPNDPMLEEL